MACLDKTLPKWLKRAVRLGAISLPNAYLLMWYSSPEMEWIPLPESLEQEMSQVMLLQMSSFEA